MPPYWLEPLQSVEGRARFPRRTRLESDTEASPTPSLSRGLSWPIAVSLRQKVAAIDRAWDGPFGSRLEWTGPVLEPGFQARDLSLHGGQIRNRLRQGVLRRVV